MTAEIAVLNKTAVALATDSAVTISAGAKEEKIFDSGDKLFELSHHYPIGIMIYNDMQFLEIPLPVIIKDFRDKDLHFDRVQDAADAFLAHLNDLGSHASWRIHIENIRKIIKPVVERMFDRFQRRFLQTVMDDKNADPPDAIANRVLDEVISNFERGYLSRPIGVFYGVKRSPRFTKKYSELVYSIVHEYFGDLLDSQRDRIIGLFKHLLMSDFISPSRTGIVIAGFGEKDLFPTLVANEIDGILFGNLKLKQTHYCDIDRDGDKAAIIPFAQKEMVDRFLYGLDDEIQRKVVQYASETITSIGNSLIKTLKFKTKKGKFTIESNLSKANSAFVNGLRDKAFEEIRSQSRKEIEDIVEFMPKPEIAKMAEALIELTSIKRRVTKGMETVREPVDVAVISRSEGFVWVKRKFYFSEELNPRYRERLRHTLEERRT